MLNRRQALTAAALAMAGRSSWFARRACAQDVPFVDRTATIGDDSTWESSSQAAIAVERGLGWLAANQGSAGNWGSSDLGLVGLGALAFLAAGHAPGRSKYGTTVARALDFILSSAKPSGLLNISSPNNDMYNHGLAVFVLTQAFGVHDDRRMSPALDKGLKLISNVQSDDGGWNYIAAKHPRGHDLSLTVMQAKALRAGMDMGMDIPSTVVDRAIAYIRGKYSTAGPPDGKRYGSDPLAARPGAFTYTGGEVTRGAEPIAMAACGAVCLQEFGQYDDFRIFRSLDLAAERYRKFVELKKNSLPGDAYMMYYLAQGLYQVGNPWWKREYPFVRDTILRTQAEDGSWEGGHRHGRPGKLFGTAVGAFVLSIPNRYLPILQRGERMGRGLGG
ncbi:MAG TPA: prenyltransferase/squalene oxidase repeat-containing protein [Thermoguttaceae bacterium]|nr:prenyltransferase/squalene oxidase repeat-containing protein [Thermoguttaceae bacterium]